MTMRLGLTARLAAIVVTLLLTVWIGLIAVFYRANGLDHSATRPSPERLAAIAEVVSAAPPANRLRLLEAIGSSALVLAIEPAPAAGAATGSAGSKPAATERPGNAAERAALERLLGDRLIGYARVGRDGAIVDLSRIFTVALAATRVRLRLDDGSILRVDAQTSFPVTFYGLPAGLGAGLFGTVAALLGFLLLHREIRPLTRLAKAVDSLDPYGEPVSLPKVSSRAPETAALFSAIDRLQTRLQALIRSRFALIGGVQHDVRSFATRLRLRVEAIPDPEERDRAAADITDMIGLLDTALLTARAGVGALNEELFDLAAFVEAEVGDMAAVGMPVVIDAVPGDGEAAVIADRVAMRRILANLVDNAVKYGGEAEVKMRTEAASVLIAVSDRGPGIREEEVDLLFEPFVRAEPSRSRATGGAGLGLAVVRSLVEAQQGTIAIGRATIGGACVELRFPKFAPC